MLSKVSESKAWVSEGPIRSFQGPERLEPPGPPRQLLPISIQVLTSERVKSDRGDLSRQQITEEQHR